MNITIKKIRIVVFLIIFFAIIIFNDKFMPVRKEITELELIKIIGKDAINDGKYKIESTILRVKGETGSSDDKEKSKESSQKANFFSVKGISNSDIVRTIQTYTDKHITGSHLKYSLIGEEACKQDLTLFFDFNIRDYEVRLNTSIYVTKGTTAKEFIKQVVNEEYEIDEKIDGMEKGIKSKSVITKITTIDLLKILTQKNGCGLLPTLKVISEKEESDKEESSKEESSKEESNKEENSKEESNKEENSKEESSKEESSKEESNKEENSKEESSKEESSKEESNKEENSKEESSKEESSKEESDKEAFQIAKLDNSDNIIPIFDFDGYAIIYNNSLKAYLSREESITTNMLKDKSVGTNLNIENDDGKIISFGILRSGTKYKAKFENNHLSEIIINTKFESNFDEILTNEDVFTEEKILKLKQKQEEQIKEEIEKVIGRLKEYGCDFLNITDKIKVKYPFKYSKIEENFQDELLKAKFTINVECNIKTTYDILRISD